MDRARSKVIAVCTAMAAAAVLSGHPAHAAGRLSRVLIPAQPVDGALRELAKQTGESVLFSAPAVKGLTSSPVDTTATAEEAARTMLRGVKLDVLRSVDGALIVRSHSLGPEAAQPATVRRSTARLSNPGPVRD
jgi:hypothetical protein